MAHLYQTHLSNMPGIILPTEKPWATNVYWMYAVRIDPNVTKLSRNTLMKSLMKRHGVQTRTFFYGPKTAFRSLHMFQRSHFPVAQSLEKTGFYLPSGLGNTAEEIIFAAGAVLYELKKNKRG